MKLFSHILPRIVIFERKREKILLAKQSLSLQFLFAYINSILIVYS